MMKRSHLPILALVAVLSVSCGSGGNFNLISVEEEWQLGQQLAQEVESQVRIVNDPQAEAYIRSVGQRIVAQTPMANLPWTFRVVDDPEINAFAIPGGHVYVNTGLIAAAGNASELAGVMGHEISHVVARHSTEQMSRQYGLSVVAGLLLGQNPGVIQQIAAQIVAGGALARYSRDAEREADELGQKFMYQANYDPRGMASMFRKLMEQQRSNPSRVEQFFSTHPQTEERIQAAEKRAASMAPRSGMITDEPEFQALHRRFR